MRRVESERSMEKVGETAEQTGFKGHIVAHTFVTAGKVTASTVLVPRGDTGLSFEYLLSLVFSESFLHVIPFALGHLPVRV